jgi:hypothetical protein
VPGQIDAGSCDLHRYRSCAHAEFSQLRQAGLHDLGRGKAVQGDIATQFGQRAGGGEPDPAQ